MTLFNMDKIRLRRLLQENILKVEKENWNLINKENIQKENLKISTKCFEEIQDFVVNKGSKNIASKHNKVKHSNVSSTFCRKNSSLQSNLNSSPHTTLLNSNVQPKKVSTSSTYCDEPFDIHHLDFLNHFQSQLYQQRLEIRKKYANRNEVFKAVPLCHPIQKDVPFTVEKLHNNKQNNTFVVNKYDKKLTLQKMPSITIANESSENNSNILLEEIGEYDEDIQTEIPGDSTIAPFFVTRNTSRSYLSERNKILNTSLLRRSENVANCESNIDKHLLKALVREILEESGSQILLESNKENTSSSTITASHCDSFKEEKENYNCHVQNARNTLHTQTKEATTCSNFSQTDSTDTSPDKLKMNRESIINLIQGQISALPVAIKNINRESISPVHSLKVEKITQTEITPVCENLSLDFAGSREIQENISEKESLNIKIVQELENMSSKMEIILKVISNHIAEKSMLFDGNFLQNDSHNIHTRDVSLQFGPHVINKSSNTSPIRTAEKTNQCVNYPIMCDASSQETMLSTHFQTCDAWVQTQNSSPSITPVSDIPFLDDVLSDGEVPLHLKFLSFHGPQSSIFADSIEERDYSLSEGEIHPHFLHSTCNASPLVDHEEAQLCVNVRGRKPSKNCSDGEVTSFFLETSGGSHKFCSSMLLHTPEKSNRTKWQTSPSTDPHSTVMP